MESIDSCKSEVDNIKDKLYEAKITAVDDRWRERARAQFEEHFTLSRRAHWQS